MKNLAFLKRFQFAVSGIYSAIKTESSFKTQWVGLLFAISVLVVLRPQPVWWAVVIGVAFNVLAFELINTALESVMDCVHPEFHPLIKRAKDIAAGAVLLTSFAALIVFALLAFDRLLR